jgi:cytosine/uracil/thiamine/allantoin permease
VSNPNTITSANSVFILTAPDLYPAGVLIQGYAVDKAFATDALEIAETMMGVDGQLTGGYTPAPVKMTVSLQADSPSKDIFSNLVRTTKTQRDIIYLNAVITLPGPGEIYTCTNGILTTAKQMPDGQKVLQPQDFVITWESVDISLL